MNKIILSVAALVGTLTLAEASAVPAKKTAAYAGGEVSGQIKAMHIITDKANGFAPEDGSGYLGVLKYVTPELYTGLKVGAAFYINGDTGLTDWDDSSKNAQGMFTAEFGETNTLLGQAYIEYKSSMVDATIGRQILNTPLTKIKWSLMPNFYQAAVATFKPMKSLSITALHIDKMAYGSRSATDFSLIGEKTGTAGVVTPAIGQPKNGGYREQAKFLNIGSASVKKDTSGITAASITYKANNLKISVWDYIASDISNSIYADVSYKMPVMKGTKLSLNAQYLKQTDSGDSLAGELDFQMYGAKAKIGNKKWSAYIAYNKSGDDGQYYNAWGSDPAYTSSIFSRNAYRNDVSAYKIGGHYAIRKGLKIVVSHADYGQSQTLGWGSTASVQDATETDIVLVYKPTKAWMLKLFNAQRTSEYSTATKERKQNHVRAVASYKF